MIVNRPVSDVTWQTATCNGRLEVTGGVSTDVKLLWGDNTDAWANTNVVATYSTATDLSKSITGLKPYTNYYYTFAASNVYGQKVAASPRKFGAGLPAWGADLEYIIQGDSTNYGVHEFTAVGTNYLFTATDAQPLTAEYLIIGGGGGAASGNNNESSGGGGGSWDMSGGTGGAGGGGDGGGWTSGNATPGDDGKGAGGGGGSGNGGDKAGRVGGSGIVIVRYEIPPPPPPKGTVIMLR